jgi:hypothetical protein
LVGFDVSQQQINLIRRFNSNVQTPDSAITLDQFNGGGSPALATPEKRGLK